MRIISIELIADLDPNSRESWDRRKELGSALVYDPDNQLTMAMSICGDLDLHQPQSESLYERQELQ